VIAALGDTLHDNYIFPEVAERLAKSLKAKDAQGGYAAATNAEAFSEMLTSDLRSRGKDGHFRVEHAPGYTPHPTTLGGAAPPKEELEAMRREIASMAFGLQRVERLDGNVGYMELRAFGPTDMVGEALASAMQLLSGTDALILDLRRNGGGEPATVAFLMSHFFAEGDRRHLNDIYTRPTNQTEQFWTDAKARTRYLKPVYVLTSPRTFSGGEECAYDFQTQKRGIVVGETTGGGANPGDDFSITHDFVAFIPTGKAINPVTHTNWEHVGVKPDIAVPAADAQKTAYAAALRTLAGAAKNPQEKAALEAKLRQVEAGVVDVPRYTAHP
jgi:C-terminal processing protease CtpA/Prc